MGLSGRGIHRMRDAIREGLYGLEVKLRLRGMGNLLVIFDLDGTLLNTISDLGHACNYALRRMEFPEHAISEYNRMVGNGLRNLIIRAAPKGTSPEIIDLLVAYCKEYYNEHCTDTTVPYPGIPELLKELSDRGVKIAVASNKYQAAVETVVSYYFPDIPFFSIQGQIDNRPIKPDPAIIESILEEDKTIEKQNVMMVGDSGVDMITAARAGVRSVGVTWGFRPVSELREASAQFIITHPSQLLKLTVRENT